MSHAYKHQLVGSCPGPESESYTIIKWQAPEAIGGGPGERWDEVCLHLGLCLETVLFVFVPAGTRSTFICRTFRLASCHLAVVLHFLYSHGVRTRGVF